VVIGGTFGTNRIDKTLITNGNSGTHLELMETIKHLEDMGYVKHLEQMVCNLDVEPL